MEPRGGVGHEEDETEEEGGGRVAGGWMEAAGKCRPDEQGGREGLGNNLSDVCCMEVRVLFLSSPQIPWQDSLLRAWEDK